jgi:hypothetical protein
MVVMQMKLRKFRLFADDGSTSINISVTVMPNEGYALEEHELDQFAKVTARRIAEVLPGLPFSDFGIENTRIEPAATKQAVSPRK